MGEENNGILFLGIPYNEVDFTALKDFDLEDFENDYGALMEWSVRQGHGTFRDGGLLADGVWPVVQYRPGSSEDLVRSS